MNNANPLLMRCSIEELRQKLSTPDSPLAPWWQHFLTLSRPDDWLSPYPVLAAIVTGEERDRRRAREVFLRFASLSKEGNGSIEAQLHTHVTAAPLGRWAIFYDWVADLELFSPAEDAAIRAALLDHAFVFPMQALQGRIRSFDNQILSNAFGVAAVGYVLGIKRGESALGRRLFSSGLGWLLELLKRLPQGGYSGEGSTYQEHVVLPMVLLASLLVEETTGADVIRDGVPPGPPALGVLQLTHRLIGPAGLLPAWDDHGFQAATVKGPLAFLARATGDPEPLATIRQHDMWYRLTLPAWETDDRLWTLVWWPDELDTGQAEQEYSAWMEGNSCGALQNASNKLRLFQYWDVCGGLLQAGRLQTDPNAITLEAFGSPLLVDGHGQLPVELLPLPAAARDYVGARRLETMKEYRGAMDNEAALRLSLSGGIGVSNALILDGEDWYVPEQPCVGNGEALHNIGPLQVVRSDATSFYTGRYDVQSVTRTSMLVKGNYVFVCDRVQSETPHTLTWQAFVREAAREEDGRVVIQTPEQVRCDLIPLQTGELELVPVEGYPTNVVHRSARVRHTLPPATSTRIDVALVPQAGLELVQDLTDTWQRKIGDAIDNVSVETAYLNDPATMPDLPRSYYQTFELELQQDEEYFLMVQRAPVALEVRVNGQLATPTMQQEKGIWKESATFLPHVFHITSLLHDGCNEVEITAPFFHGESVAGPVHLCRQRASLPVHIERTGDDTFRASVGDDVDELLIERGALGQWLNGETDARYAVCTADGTIAAVGVSSLYLPDKVNLQSQPACDVAWSGVATKFAQLPIGTRLEIAQPTGRLRIECGGCLEITYTGTQPHRLEVPWPTDRIVTVNGRVQSTLMRRDGSVRLELSPSPSLAEIDAPKCVEEVYSLAASQGAEAADELLAALRSEDWRIQVAAADVVGRLGLTETVPILLELFEEAEAELPYQGLEKWWRWSKMLMRAKPHNEGIDPTLTETGVKRWRVKRAAVTALGLLGDPRAVAPLEAALARCDDFFPVTSQLAVALGRLGAESSTPVLERHIDHAEVNTRVHSRLALALIRSETSREIFEARVGLP